jgi:pectate lyase-like protein
MHETVVSVPDDGTSPVGSDEWNKRHTGVMPVVNVKDPMWAGGAKGDGVTNDTAAIQAAIDSIPQTGNVYGGTVFFPPGDYLCAGQINMDSKLGITMLGISTGAWTRQSPRLLYSGTGTAPFIQARSSNGLRFIGLHFEPQSNSFTGDLLNFDWLTASPADVAALHIEDCQFGPPGTGVGQSARSYIRLNKVIFSTIRWCAFRWGVSHIRVGDPDYTSGISFENNTHNLASDTPIIASAGESIAFRDCWFETNIDDSARAYRHDPANPCLGLVFTGCWFGDAIAGGSWIEATGRGIMIIGNRMGSPINACVKLTTCTGVVVSGNEFGGETALEFVSANSDIWVMANSMTVVTPYVNPQNVQNGFLQNGPNVPNMKLLGAPLQLASPIYASDGTPTAPSFSYANDPDTGGGYRAGPNVDCHVAGGVIVVSYNHVALAVDWIALYPGLSGTPPKIAAEGLTTNQGVDIVPKGTGATRLGGGGKLTEIAAPATPPANELHFYAKDKAGASEFFYKNDAGVERDLSVSGGGVTDHGALTGLSDDDHTQYQKVSEKDQANGYASLDGTTKVPIAKVPTGTSASTVALGDHTHAGVISRGATVLNPVASDLIVWRAPYACTVTNVRGYRVGGTGATINARRNGTSAHLSSDLSLTSADTWVDGGAVQNTAYAAGDKMEIRVMSVAGAPTQVAIQVDLTRP